MCLNFDKRSEKDGKRDSKRGDDVKGTKIIDTKL